MELTDSIMGLGSLELLAASAFGIAATVGAYFVFVRARRLTWSDYAALWCIMLSGSTSAACGWAMLDDPTVSWVIRAIFSATLGSFVVLGAMAAREHAVRDHGRGIGSTYWVLKVLCFFVSFATSTTATMAPFEYVRQSKAAAEQAIDLSTDQLGRSAQAQETAAAAAAALEAQLKRDSEAIAPARAALQAALDKAQSDPALVSMLNQAQALREDIAAKVFNMECEERGSAAVFQTTGRECFGSNGRPVTTPGRGAYWDSLNAQVNGDPEVEGSTGLRGQLAQIEAAIERTNAQTASEIASARDTVKGLDESIRETQASLRDMANAVTEQAKVSSASIDRIEEGFSFGESVSEVFIFFALMVSSVLAQPVYFAYWVSGEPYAPMTALEFNRYSFAFLVFGMMWAIELFAQQLGVPKPAARPIRHRAPWPGLLPAVAAWFGYAIHGRRVVWSYEGEDVPEIAGTRKTVIEPSSVTAPATKEAARAGATAKEIRGEEAPKKTLRERTSAVFSRLAPSVRPSVKNKIPDGQATVKGEKQEITPTEKVVAATSENRNEKAKKGTTPMDPFELEADITAPFGDAPALRDAAAVVRGEEEPTPAWENGSLDPVADTVASHAGQMVADALRDSVDGVKEDTIEFTPEDEAPADPIKAVERAQGRLVAEKLAETIDEDPIDEDPIDEAEISPLADEALQLIEGWEGEIGGLRDKLEELLDPEAADEIVGDLNEFGKINESDVIEIVDEAEERREAAASEPDASVDEFGKTAERIRQISEGFDSEDDPEDAPTPSGGRKPDAKPGQAATAPDQTATGSDRTATGSDRTGDAWGRLSVPTSGGLMDISLSEGEDRTGGHGGHTLGVVGAGGEFQPRAARLETREFTVGGHRLQDLPEISEVQWNEPESRHQASGVDPSAVKTAREQAAEAAANKLSREARTKLLKLGNVLAGMTKEDGTSRFSDQSEAHGLAAAYVKGEPLPEGVKFLVKQAEDSLGEAD